MALITLVIIPTSYFMIDDGDDVTKYYYNWANLFAMITFGILVNASVFEVTSLDTVATRCFAIAYGMSGLAIIMHWTMRSGIFSAMFGLTELSTSGHTIFKWMWELFVTVGPYLIMSYELFIDKITFSWYYFWTSSILGFVYSTYWVIVRFWHDDPANLNDLKKTTIRQNFIYNDFPILGENKWVYSTVTYIIFFGF